MMDKWEEAKACLIVFGIPAGIVFLYLYLAG